MSNKKLALFLTCCAVAGISTSCNESKEWRPTVCEEGAKTCLDNAINECKDGNWEVTEACTGDKPYCDSSKMECAGKPEAECIKGQTACNNNTLKTCGEDGKWVVIECGDKTCNAAEGKCDDKDVPACEAGCKDGSMTSCNEAGEATVTECQYGCKEDGTACNDAPTTDCNEGDKKCDGDKIAVCDAEGKWGEAADCETDGEVCKTNDAGVAGCVAEEPKPECVAGCADNKVTTCDEDGNPVVNDCTYGCNEDGTACNEAPVTGCTEGDKKCDGDKIAVCDAEGNWGEATDCENEGEVCKTAENGTASCVAGEVEDKCTEGDKKCDGDKIAVCDAEGNWGEAADCENEGEVCKTDENGAASCVAETKKNCTVGEGDDAVEYKHGDKICTSDTEISECIDGVMTPVETACAGDKPVCVEGECVECANDDTNCVYDETAKTHTLYTCVANEWNEGEACTNGKVCDTAEPSKECVDPATLIGCAEGEDMACATVYGTEYATMCKNDGSVMFSLACEDGEKCAVDAQTNSVDCIEISENTGVCGTPAEECDSAEYNTKANDWCKAATGDSFASAITGDENLVCIADGEKACLIDTTHCRYCGNNVVDTYNEACDGSDIGEMTCADFNSEKTWKEGGAPACENCMLTIGTCEEDTSTPEPTGYTTIKSIKDDFDAISAKTGKTSVDIAGVVTAVAADGKAFVMQDADGVADAAAVYVYCKTVCDPVVAVGNNVTVKSESQPEIFSSLLEVVSPVTTVVVASGIVTPVEKTIADVIANVPKNANDSMLVTLKGIQVEELLKDTNDVVKDVSLTDGTDKIYVATKFNADSVNWFSEDFKYDVTGTVYVFNRKVTGAAAKADITHIGVRTIEDVVAVGCVDADKTFVAATADAPAKCEGGSTPDLCAGKTCEVEHGSASCDTATGECKIDSCDTNYEVNGDKCEKIIDEKCVGHEGEHDEFCAEIGGDSYRVVCENGREVTSGDIKTENCSDGNLICAPDVWGYACVQCTTDDVSQCSAPANATAYCKEGAYVDECAWTCNSGYKLNDTEDGCVLDVIECENKDYINSTTSTVGDSEYGCNSESEYFVCGSTPLTDSCPGSSVCNPKGTTSENICVECLTDAQCGEPDADEVAAHIAYACLSNSCEYKCAEGYEGDPTSKTGCVKICKDDEVLDADGNCIKASSIECSFVGIDADGMAYLRMNKNIKDTDIVLACGDLSTIKTEAANVTADHTGSDHCGIEDGLGTNQEYAAFTSELGITAGSSEYCNFVIANKFVCVSTTEKDWTSPNPVAIDTIRGGLTETNGRQISGPAAAERVTLASWDFNDGDAIVDGGVLTSSKATFFAGDGANYNGTVVYQSGFSTGSAPNYPSDKAFFITLDTTGYKNIKISFKYAGSGTDNKSFNLAYSVGDGFMSVGKDVSDTAKNSLKSYPETALPDADNKSRVEIGIFPYALAGSGSTARVDDIVITGEAM